MRVLWYVGEFFEKLFLAWQLFSTIIIKYERIWIWINQAKIWCNGTL